MYICKTKTYLLPLAKNVTFFYLGRSVFSHITKDVQRSVVLHHGRNICLFSFKKRFLRQLLNLALVMHVSAASPGVRPPGTPGDLSKTPNKAYLIPWGMEQEKVTKFPHLRVPKEVRERTVHVRL